MLLSNKLSSKMTRTLILKHARIYTPVTY